MVFPGDVVGAAVTVPTAQMSANTISRGMNIMNPPGIEFILCYDKVGGSGTEFMSTFNHAMPALTH
jgi:hypothetical protein